MEKIEFIGEKLDFHSNFQKIYTKLLITKNENDKLNFLLTTSLIEKSNILKK
jgi:hypothetical protein